MACAAFHLFAAIVAALPAQFGGLDALAVQRPSGGVLVAPGLLAYLGAQGIMEPLPVPAVTPLAEVPIDTRPFGVLMGEHAPFDAPVDHIKDRIDHRTHLQRTRVSTRFGGGDQIFDTIPFGISEVCGVWIGVHPQHVPN